MRAPLVGNFLDAFLQVLIERKLLPVDPVAENLNALVRDRAKELVGGIGKQPHPVADELVGDRLQRDAGAVDLAEHALRVGDIFLQRVAQLAVIAERVDRRQWHGVDRVRADQLLDVKNVAIDSVLGAGRSP